MKKKSKQIIDMDWDAEEGAFGNEVERKGIPMINALEDEELFEQGTEMDVPILPIRNTVLFPGVVIPITVGRERSIRLVKKVYKGDKTLGVITQRNAESEHPKADDLYTMGTVGRILKMLHLPNGNTTIIVQGQQRFVVKEFTAETPHLLARINIVEDQFPSDSRKEVKALMESVKETALKIIKLNPEIPQEAQIALENIETNSFLVYFLSSNLNIDAKEKQGILEILEGEVRATKLLEHLLKEVQMLEMKSDIRNKVNTDIDQQQRDYFLRQQMKVLQDELGNGSEQEVERLRAKAATKDWPDYAREHFNKEIERLARMNSASAEYPVYFNYCELMVELPWNEVTADQFDLKHAREILERDHHGLAKVKKRIIEFLAVLKLKNDMRGPILCLYGPPGVGKTSLGKSIAEAMGRKYVRMSLGGLRDEAELRGHRKTYIGAMAGRLLQNLKRSGSSNPVFILDEIDKLSADFRGDPSSALLEILDPEQNNSFVDNYLEIPYDLSKVLFIATANSLDGIQPALRDRMEIIEINGYTQEEKLQIAKLHLVSKQRKDHGLLAKHISFQDKSLEKIIDEYTRESGVRTLERQIGSVVRHIATSVAMEEEYNKSITPKRVEEILGAPIFDKELYQDNQYAGVVTGLAWTPVGGEILFLEASLNRGRGKLILSGQLGDVMKESAMAALSFLRANAETLDIDYRIFEQYDLHVHVPAGAVPKDGPSAGVSMLTALASIYTQRKVKPRLAMTGEITLRGKVLAVGGIKEKLLAAKRAGIVEIILPKKNKKDIAEIEASYLEGLKLHFADHVEDVLALALLKEKVAKPMHFHLENAPSPNHAQ